MFHCRDEYVDNINKLIEHLHFEDQKDNFFRRLARSCNLDNPLPEIIKTHLDDVIKPSATATKEFTYTNSIISLYGYLESFLEQLTEEFITSINDVSIPVSALPSAVRERHLELSMQFLTKNAKSRNQDDAKKRECEKQVIANLHSFLQENDKYTLNSKAFSVHTANFRYNLIQSYFAQIGVECIADRTLGLSDVTAKLATRQQQSPTDEKSVLKSWLEYELDELAQLRNEIAHGAFEGSIENFNLIIERAEFIKHFGLALAEIVYKSFQEIVFYGKEQIIIGKADKAFPKHSSFGFTGKGLSGHEELKTITVGDEIFARNTSAIISGLIHSLVLNKETVNQIEYPSEQDFSIKVNFDVTNNMTNRVLSISKRGN